MKEIKKLEIGTKKTCSKNFVKVTKKNQLSKMNPQSHRMLPYLSTVYRTQPTFQRQINVVSTLLINFDITFIRC